jgi:hypothetical protein
VYLPGFIHAKKKQSEILALLPRIFEAALALKLQQRPRIQSSATTIKYHGIIIQAAGIVERE